ncbi:MAG: hypothetical protein ACRD1D_12505 [Acidimicrobiales bacterium]
MARIAVLAHGGVAGAAFELGFVVVPLVIFAVLSRISKRRRDQEEDPSDDDEVPG